MRRVNIVFTVLIALILINTVISDDIPTIEVAEGELVKLKLTATDEDGDKLTYTFSDPLSDNGEWQTNYGDAGEYLAKVVVSDGKAETEKEIKIIVHRSNRPPVLEELLDIVVEEGDTVVVEPVAEDDEGYDVEFTISEPIGDDGVWETGYDDEGEYAIEVTASDDLHTVAQSFTLTVTDKNRDPTILDFRPDYDEVKIDEDEEISFEVNAEDEDGEAVSYLWKLDGQEVGTDNEYSYYANFDAAGTHTLQVDVSDQQAILRKEWTIIVENINRPPTLEDIPNIVVDETANVIVDFTAIDPDRDDIVYSITDPIGSDKEWQTTYDDAGEYEITVTISDGQYEDSKSFYITVNDVDRAPIFNEISDVQITEEEKVSITLKVEDEDGDEITFMADSLPYGSTLEDNVFEFAPTYETVQKPGSWFNNILKVFHLDNLYYGNSRELAIKFTAAGKEKATEQVVNIKVTNVNLPPRFLEMDDITISEDQVVKIRPVAVDPDNDRLKFTASDPIGKDLKWKTNYNDNGDYTITLTATDGEYEVTKDINVIVENVNRIPKFKNIPTQKLKEGEEITVPITVTDEDEDPIDLSLEGDGELSNNSIIYTPSFNTAEKDQVTDVVMTLSAADWKEEVKQDVLFKVKDVNRPPVMLDTTTPKEDTIIAYLNEAVLFDAVVEDPDGDALSYTWKFSAFNKVEGSPKMKRTFRKTGEKTIALIISDGDVEIKKEWIVDVVGKRPVTATPKPSGKVLKYEIDNSLAS